MIVDGVQIDFGIIDQTIQKDIDANKMTGTTTSDSPYSSIKNTINVSETQEKIAYLEKDYFLLDGSFTLPEEDKIYNVGYESSNVSLETTGDIDEYVEYKFENTHVSYGMQLYFREDCIVKNFTVDFYKDEQQLESIVVENNLTPRWVDDTAVIDWNKIRILFTKVKPQQRARLSEIIFGINEHFTEDNLILVTASQRTDISGDYNDCGDFSFSFFNEKLGMLNVKGLALGLMEWLRTVIYVKYHGQNEYKRFGEYYSQTADVQNHGKIAYITGYDRLFLLNESYYRRGVVFPMKENEDGTVSGGRSLGEWAEDVADDAGIEVIIDPEFYEIISYGYITDVPHREALRLIAEAGNGILIVEPTGEIHLKKFTVTDKGVLSDDDIVDNRLTIENSQKNLGININTYTFQMRKTYYEDEEELTRDLVELSYIEEVGLAEEPQTIDVVYGTYPVWIGDITIQSTGEIVTSPQIFIDTSKTNAQVTNINRYADHISFDISLKPENDPTYDPEKIQNYTWVTITGRPYNTINTSVVRGSLVKNVKEIKDNYLITANLADSVANYQYNVAGRKYNYNAEIVIEEEINIEDRVEIQGNKVLVEGVKFALEYGEYSVEIEGIDE